MIKEARLRLDVSKYKLCQVARLDQKYYTSLERGESLKPGRPVLMRLARAIPAYTKLYDERWVDKVLDIAGFLPPPEPLPEEQRELQDHWLRFWGNRDDLRYED